MAKDKADKSEMTQLFNQVQSNCSAEKSVLMDIALSGTDPTSALDTAKIDCSKIKPAAGATLEGEKARGEKLDAAKRQLKAIDNRRSY